MQVISYVDVRELISANGRHFSVKGRHFSVKGSSGTSGDGDAGTFENGKFLTWLNALKKCF